MAADNDWPLRFGGATRCLEVLLGYSALGLACLGAAVSGNSLLLLPTIFSSATIFGADRDNWILRLHPKRHVETAMSVRSRLS
jgi:hypothetical protein